jgi:hypothetical protein
MPRRARPGPLQVTTCEALRNMSEPSGMLFGRTGELFHAETRNRGEKEDVNVMVVSASSRLRVNKDVVNNVRVNNVITSTVWP